MPARSVQAPVGGWNARDALDDMAEEDALVLINLIPDSGYVKSRPGFASHSTGLGGNVETIAEFASGSSRKLIAAANGNIWDATAATPTSLGSGFTEDAWQTTMTHGRLLLVNGTDATQEYDGSTLSAMSLTGPTDANVIGLMPYKGRVFYFEDESQSFWYAAAASYKGALTEFKLERQLELGGKLQQMVTLTHDAGDGVDDYAAFIFSTGEVLVYQGSDPGSVNDWFLVGRYRVGEPIGNRCSVRLGTSVVVVTRDGYIDLTQELYRRRLNENNFSGKIIEAVKDRTRNFSGTVGWQPVFYPRESLILVNVPIVANAQYEQHVLNTNTGAWCKWTGINASAMGLYNDDLYFGTNGTVWKIDPDTVNDDGTPIEHECTTAFWHLGGSASRAIFTGCNILSTYLTPDTLGIEITEDFRIPSRPPVSAPGIAAGSAWDTSDWNTAEWGRLDGALTPAWMPLAGSGYALALSVRFQADQQRVKWYATQITYKPGGPV